MSTNYALSNVEKRSSASQRRGSPFLVYSGDHLSKRGEILDKKIQSGFLISTKNSDVILITTTSESDLVISGTDVPVHRITALIDAGMPPNEIAKDFPSLDMEQISAASQTTRSEASKVDHAGTSLKHLLRNSKLDKLDAELAALKAKGRKGK